MASEIYAVNTTNRQKYWLGKGCWDLITDDLGNPPYGGTGIIAPTDVVTLAKRIFKCLFWRGRRNRADDIEFSIRLAQDLVALSNGEPLILLDSDRDDEDIAELEYVRGFGDDGFEYKWPTE